MVERKAQAWGFDLMIASVIFMAGIIFLYINAINHPDEGKNNLDLLFNDGDAIAEIVLSDGYPANWNESNVVLIGILSDNKINQTKLENFYNLVQEDYNRTKSLFNTNNEYWIEFSENVNLPGNPEGIGNNPVESKNLIRTTRLSVYNNQPIVLDIYTWK